MGDWDFVCALCAAPFSAASFEDEPEHEVNGGCPFDSTVDFIGEIHDDDEPLAASQVLNL